MDDNEKYRYRESDGEDIESLKNDTLEKLLKN